MHHPLEQSLRQKGRSLSAALSATIAVFIFVTLLVATAFANNDVSRSSAGSSHLAAVSQPRPPTSAPVGVRPLLAPSNGTDPWVEMALDCSPTGWCTSNIYHLDSYTYVPTGAPTDNVGQQWAIWLGEQPCYYFCGADIPIIQAGIAWEPYEDYWCGDTFTGFAIFVMASQVGGSSCSNYIWGWAPVNPGDYIYLDVNDMQAGGSEWEAQAYDENTGYATSMYNEPLGSTMPYDFIVEEVYDYPSSNCNAGLWPSPTQETFTPISTLGSPSWQISYPNSYCDEKVNAVSNSVTLYWA